MNDTARWTLVACIVASSLAFIDGSVVNVALPTIGRDLQAGPAALQWTINAYLLPLSALLLLGGAAGDRFGRRRLLIGGIALFAVASLGCAWSPTLVVLLPARVAQGIGAAMLMPNSLALLGNAFTGEARGRAIGTWAAAGAIAGAVGPPLGGWLVGAVGWRAIFYLNVPLATAAIAVAWAYVEESGEGTLPLPALIGGASRGMGRVAERIGPRWPLTLGPLVVAGGSALMAASDPRGSYWTGLLPALLVIAAGMAGAVAPLTTAVLGAVDAQHTGTASGFNSAIARTGGLLATAATGAVVAVRGDALVTASRVAADVGAALALFAALIALLTLGPTNNQQRK